MLNASFLWVVTRVQTSYLDFLGGELENKIQLTQSRREKSEKIRPVAVNFPPQAEPNSYAHLGKGGGLTDHSCM